MPATVRNFPFQLRAVRIEAITASHSLSVERNEYFGLGIVSSTPFWVVASQASQIVLHLLGHRSERQAHAGRDGAGDDVDLVLQGELAEALDGVLGARLFLDDELDLASENPAGSVDPVRRPTAHRAVRTRRRVPAPRPWPPGRRSSPGRPVPAQVRRRAAGRRRPMPRQTVPGTLAVSSSLCASLLESPLRGPCADGTAPAAAYSIPALFRSVVLVFSAT